MTITFIGALNTPGMNAGAHFQNMIETSDENLPSPEGVPDASTHTSPDECKQVDHDQLSI